MIAHQDLEDPDDGPGHALEAGCYPGGGCGVTEGSGCSLRYCWLASSLPEETPTSANAMRLAKSPTRQSPVGSAGHPIPVSITSAQAAAARNYVRRIPDSAQQSYAEEYLVWALAGKPRGGGPLMRGFGLSLAAGCQLAATVERLLGLTPMWPGRRRRR